jgi:hypothetical protein
MSYNDLAAVVGGAGACGYALFQFVRAGLASRWPTTEGEIAGTRLVHRGGSTATDPGAEYDYVAYRYRVDGQPFRNDRVRFGPVIAPSSILPGADQPPDDPAGARALAERYPTGMPVRVYYNPKDPADSVLHPMPSITVWIILFVGLIFVAAGIQHGF